ncbi:AAA family ATPase, partial [Arthrobacter deserti]|nr:AAA family ATPase [Arthrobacter deserti]
MLAAQPPGQGLAELDYEVLLERLKTLVKDKQTLVTLPERTLLLEQMRERGLGDLLDDLAAREVGPHQVGAGLELAWWQSTLEAMISGDDYLAMTDGANLRKIEAVYRLADDAHIASGAARLRGALAESWRASIKKHPAPAEGLKALLKSGGPTLKTLAEQSAVLLPALMPVWAAPPLVLSSVLPDAKTFDAVIVLDAESASLQSALAAVVRARQVIAFGDGRLGGARPFEVNADISPPNASGPEQPGGPLTSAFDALARVLPVKRLTTAYRAVDLELTKYLGAEFYDGT